MKTYKDFDDYLSDVRANNNVRSVFNQLICRATDRNSWEYSMDAESILFIVAKYGQGFVVDICNKALYDHVYLSEKQRWCVAFALMKVTDEQIAEYRERVESVAAAVDAGIEAFKQNDYGQTALQAAERAKAEQEIAEEPNNNNDKKSDNRTTTTTTTTDNNMNMKLKECAYPTNGFGGKSGMAYLLDQFGNIYDLNSEYDSVLEERYYYLVDCDGKTPYFAQGITGR